MNKGPEIKPICTDSYDPVKAVMPGGGEYWIKYGRISSPGKFGGERPYIPYYWDQYMNGYADSDDGGILRFKVTREDRQLFPGMLNRRRVISLIETDQGFVCEV